jgi:hypothetical protein
MWKSRDLTLVIIMAVTGFVYSALVYQVGFLFTGIPGANYLFLISTEFCHKSSKIPENASIIDLQFVIRQTFFPSFKD